MILGKANDYKASYSKYVELRKERQEKQIQSKKNQDKHIKHTEQLIEKFRYKKNKAAFAQSLIKKLDKLERIEVEQDDLSGMYFRFPFSISKKLIFVTFTRPKYLSPSLGALITPSTVSPVRIENFFILLGLT